MSTDSNAGALGAAQLSAKTRFAFTFGMSLLRSGVSFFTGLILARALGPSDFGNYSFLLGSFLAWRQVFDLGTSTAFYTFICQEQRSARFFGLYYAWQAVQIGAIVLAVAWLLPDSILSRIWLGQHRLDVALGFVAFFLQQQVWQTIVQVAESARLTIKVQRLGFLLALVHLVAVLLARSLGILSMKTVFGFIAVEYLAAILIASQWSRGVVVSPADRKSPRETLAMYWGYCAPLLAYTGVSFLYTFADNWLLQRFGGAQQQAFFSTGNQISSISVLATTAMVNIFWKEMAEAHSKGDLARFRRVYSRASSFLFFLAATLSCFAIPWSHNISLWLLGDSYLGTAAPLAVLFFYPIHQCLGQIVGTTYYATGFVRTYVLIGVITMLLSLPFSYFLLANESAPIPGLGLGALGMAIKMVFYQVVATGLLEWQLCRRFELKANWFRQWPLLGALVLLGFGAAWLGRTAFPAASSGLLATLPSIALALAFYSLFLIIWLNKWPALMGLDRGEIQRVLTPIRDRFWPGDR